MKLLGGSLLLVGAFLLVSLWTFWLAVRPPRILIGATPREHGLPAEDVRISTGDGLRLAAWFIPSTLPSTGGTAIVLLHGYPAEKADLLPIAMALRPRFATLLVDLRYFGGSDGGFTTLGHRERADLHCAVDTLTERGFARIGVFGYSLGGAIALLAAAQDRRIRAVVAYAPFSDLRVLAGELYGGLWLLKYPFVFLLRAWSVLFFGADITRPSPEMAAARLDIPVLVIHRKDDEQISFGHAERLRAALAANRRAEIHVGRGFHNDRDAEFDRRVVAFFGNALQ
jgi:pimeloyl-ACP methyl ester carboxylesterase